MREYQSDNSEELQLEREFQAASNYLVGSLLCKFLPTASYQVLEGVTIQLITNTKSLRFDCPSPTVAARVFKMSKTISLAIYGLKEVLKLGFIPKLEILCAGQQFIPKLNAEKLIKDCFMMTSAQNQPLPNVELDLDLNDLYRQQNPIYITQMSDQKVLFANRAALVSNNRSAGEVVGKEITALWDDEVLSTLMVSLERDRQLWQYNYRGYRWSRESDSPIWRRDRYMFVANYKLVEFLGSVCRFCTITSAEKMVNC
ncbi:MAG TPA: PAS domain-containing protein [Kamptonema sp.]|nr:PAS domain-containing protein [Kamptonema sp.]